MTIKIAPMDFDSDLIQAQSMLDSTDAGRLALCKPLLVSEALFIFVAKHRDTIQGLALTHTAYPENFGWNRDSDSVEYTSGNNAYLGNIHVTEDLRSQGIGTVLLRKSEAAAKSKGRSTYWLHVAELNRLGRQFYERNRWGYVRTLYPDWYEGKGMCVYRKDLGSLQIGPL